MKILNALMSLLAYAFLLFLMFAAVMLIATPEIKTLLSDNNSTVQSPNSIPDSQLQSAQQQCIAYKDSVSTLRWAMGIIVFAFIGFIGYGIFRNQREYEKALARAEKACEDTEKAKDNADMHEQQAREKLESIKEQEEKINKQVETKLKDIDEKVEDKLEQIENEGSQTVEKVIKEGQKQQKISDLFSKGFQAYDNKDYRQAEDCFRQITKLDKENYIAWSSRGLALSNLADIAEPAEKEDLYRQAFDKYRKATEIKPDDENAWNNWGVALCKLADIAEPAEKEDLYRQATGKYERATEIKPDNELALCGWGLALLELAARKSGDEREKLLDDAIAKFEQAERIRPGIAVYNLGCAYGLLEDKEKCRKWLEKAEQLGKLPTKEKADNDPSFVNVRNEDWFKQLNWKQQ